MTAIAIGLFVGVAAISWAALPANAQSNVNSESCTILENGVVRCVVHETDLDRAHTICVKRGWSPRPECIAMVCKMTAEQNACDKIEKALKDPEETLVRRIAKELKP